ncbi:MAG: DUF421 domain-containing protein [Oscillospiraceae bacterium]|nr:DUF421 domain-containing protein [Oscillospiraceae bacterium]
MSTILIRTLIVYAFLIIAMRIMGKRQLGEIQVSEFVITLLISELVTYPVMDGDIPMVYVAVPIITLLSAEVIATYISTKSKRAQSLLGSPPCILIEKGEIKQGNLKNVRFTLNELISEVRLKGYADITEVDYAILESNGKLSVIPKPEYKNPTVSQLNLPYINSGIAHPVVINGEINSRSVALAGKTSEWVLRTLSAQGFDSLDNICLMLVDNSDKIFIQPVDK